jgi:asparagine synthase (glutamine-hydrolysing)
MKVKGMFSEILSDQNSPIIPLINTDVVKRLMDAPSDYGKPWFGQLMGVPQMIAYLIQIDIWLRKYKIKII